MTSKMVEHANCIHSEFMTKQQSKFSDFSAVMSNKLIAQKAELIDWSDKSIKELRASQQQIDEFFTKDLCRDAETGLFYFSV